MKLLNVYSRYDITPTTGRDVYIYDDKGKKYLDFYGGHAVISIGHGHPHYVKKIQEQVERLGFYSNAVQNPLQEELAKKLGRLSGFDNYNLFLCNSGAEANENALKIASFKTGKSRVLAFKNAFHGRTSAAMAATDNPKIKAPIDAQHQVTFLELGNNKKVKSEIKKGDVCAVIIETIQGVGGLDESTTSFYKSLSETCQKNGVFLIVDEVQSGYGRTGDFFAFQKHGIKPQIITIAKGMGNGFPIGGVLFHPDIKTQYGILGSTFGGNHLACTAGIAVLDVLEQENLMDNVAKVSAYLVNKVKSLPEVKKIKGRGLILGLEFDFEVADLRKKLLYSQNVFTGSSNNKKLLRILPPLNITKGHVDIFINALKHELETCHPELSRRELTPN